ncbi:MAG: YqgE/AlgH family protein [Deltaproteobacteria bacterium]|nr:YqgE/AlgH family protein [Deltaproteobacteria bacterium]
MAIGERDTKQPTFKGQFLMAMPGLSDPNFFQTVTCICEHNSDGAVGIIINRVHPSLSGKDIFEELKIQHNKKTELIPIHIGGPVHTGEIFVLHSKPFDWASCLMVTPQLAMSNTKDIIESLALGNGPESFLIALGCAGWGPNQLESEIRQNAWLTFPAFNEAIFNVSVETRWAKAVERMGIDPNLLSEKAGNA